MAVIIYLKDILQKSSSKTAKAPATKTKITRKAQTLCASLVKRKSKTKEEAK